MSREHEASMPSTIVYLDDPEGQGIELGDEPVLIGRVTECAIKGKDDTVTRKHARIYREGNRYWIADLGSDNGTWINRMRIVAPYPLVHRDKIKCGRLALEYIES
jgi:pSer/pThr/pTyr-binding forkhead associated (FHA) protein